MSDDPTRARLSYRILWLAGALAVVAACAKVKTTAAPSIPGSGGTGISDGGGAGDAGMGAPDAWRAVSPDAAVESAGCTTKVSCTPTGGRYCGTIGDGCFGVLECGTCPADQICDSNVCVKGAACVPLSCQNATAQYCGKVGDGCGRALNCGACPADKICSASGLCVPGSGCVPLTCTTAAGVRFCGSIGDGCGGNLDCGACTAPATCGGLGIAGVCGDPNCKKISCSPAGGGQYCGKIGDGCGGTLDCGTACPGGMTCGASATAGGMGYPNVCPGTGTAGPCTGLACMIPTCSGTARTTISGTVRDPAGKVPLYNVNVYIPNAALDPIPVGASCDKCSAKLSGSPIATALTDASGHFVLQNVPATQNVPLVMQVGKWRRQVTIPSVTACVDNPITNADLTRLPRTKAEGNIPKMALTTGGSDALECLVRKIGIADSEFTTDAGTGRVHLFLGGKPGTTGEGSAGFATTLNGGAAFPNATTLWGNANKLLGYDILLMACEGSQYADVKMPYIGNVKRYADSGGRIFASHLHFYWLASGPAPWPTTATYLGGNGADPPSPVISTVDTTFPKGAALADWLVAVGASTTRGQIELWDAQHSVAATMPPTQRWIYLPENPNDTASPKRVANQYMTFNTPVEAATDAQCGRVVHSDIHVKAAPAAAGEKKDDSDPKLPFPTGCQAITLSAQEKALEFLFFDLSACVQSDKDMPVPPPVPPPGIPMTPPPITPPPPAPPPPSPPPPPPPIP